MHDMTFIDEIFTAMLALTHIGSLAYIYCMYVRMYICIFQCHTYLNVYLCIFCGRHEERNEFENIFHSNLIQVEIQERCTPQ